jgi:excinuclease ABC subunit A
VIQFFDPRRVVGFPNLSLASGAIKGWDRRNQFYFQMLQSLATHYKFDLDRPFEKLKEDIQNVVLYGSGKDTIPFSYMNERGRAVVRTHAFEGVINNLQRRYRETDSVAVREELAKYLNHKPCPECEGTRLRIEARNVRVGPRDADLPIYAVSAKPLRETLAWFSQMQLTGSKRDIAERIIKEIVSRLKFLNDVGLDYLSLDRSADTLVGRRIAAHPARIPDRLGADRRHVRARRAVDRPAPARQRPPASRHSCICAISATRSSWSNTTKT